MAEVTDSHGVTLGSTAADDGYWRGFQITTNAEVNLVKVTKHGNDASDTCILLPDGGGSVIASSSFSGNDATFSGVTLSNNTTYDIVTGDWDRGTCTQAYNSGGGSYPYNETNIDFIGSIAIGWPSYYDESVPGATNVWSIVSITTEAQANITITPSALTLSTTAAGPTINILRIPNTFSVNLSVCIPEIILESSAITYVGKATAGEKYIKTKWPVVEGLTARTQKQTGRTMNLVPQDSSLILARNKIGI